jgi:transcriptional regulator with PAS, ATPase and Fis domain
MPSPRASVNSLAKLLETLSEPVYVLDDGRRIIYCNQACREWTQCAAEDLLGKECRYHSDAAATGAEAVAVALCPPPEVFRGQRAQANIVLPSDESSQAERPAEFVPLSSPSVVVAGVIAFVAASQVIATDSGRHAAADDLHARIQRFRRRFAVRFHVDRLLGDSPSMRRVRAQVKAAAAGAASVLVVGPKGSGRQHVARAIHYAAGPDSCGPLVPLACALVDVEMPRATVRALLKPKSPTTSQTATLLLNDADELPEAVQAELSRLLAPAELPFRVIATSREPLAARFGFRNDLAYRLSTIVIDVPPLSKRIDDVGILAQAFLEQINAQGAKQLSGFSTQALDRLSLYAWPGDVDELEAIVRESHARANAAVIALGDLPERLELAADAATYTRKPKETIVLDQFMASIEHELIERALNRAKGNKAKAARLLGMTRPRLYRRLVQLGLASAEEETIELTLDESDEAQ